MAKRQNARLRLPPKPLNSPEAEKQRIVAACEALIGNVLKPRFLPAVRPTEFNYPVDIVGHWRAGRYRFMVRYRSGFADSRGGEFVAPFARIDRLGEDRLDVHRMRHTG